MCDNEVLTLKEVSKLLKMGTTIYALVRKKKIPARKIGREWRFIKSEIIEGMKEEHSKE